MKNQVCEQVRIAKVEEKLKSRHWAVGIGHLGLADWRVLRWQNGKIIINSLSTSDFGPLISLTAKIVKKKIIIRKLTRTSSILLRRLLRHYVPRNDNGYDG